MKNTVLAPIVALLVLLALMWTGLFGMSRASSMAAERSTTSTTSPRTAVTPTATVAPSSRDGADTLADGPAPPDPPSYREDTTGGGTAPTRSSSDGAAADRGDRVGTDNGDTSFVDRFTDGREGDGTTTSDRSLSNGSSVRDNGSATQNNPEDPSGLSNRGAAALLLVLVLIGAASARR